MLKVQISGSKQTIKLTPEPGQLIPLTQMLHRLPDPPKGTQNPSHWHIKIPQVKNGKNDER
jgi:hypothetical protein